MVSKTKNQTRGYLCTPNHQHQLIIEYRYTAFYFLVDVLRALRLGNPPSFKPSELTFNLNLSSEWGIQDIYRQLLLARQPLPVHLSSEHHLLGLLCILSETILLLQFLGPVANGRASPNPNLLQTQINSMYGDLTISFQEVLQWTDNRFSSGGSDMSRDFNNFSLPSSARREYSQQLDLMTASLETWHKSFEDFILYSNSQRGTSPTRGAKMVDESLLPLAYLCRILLEIGPLALELPRIAESESLISGEQDDSILNDTTSSQLNFHVNEKATDSAWGILDTFEDEEIAFENSSGNICHQTDTKLIPLWTPLVLFYAALTIWARMREEQAREGLSGIHNSLPARRRLLRLFHTKLSKLGAHYGCASQMADVIKNLELRC